MSKETEARKTRPTGAGRARHTPPAEHARKQRVLTKGRASITRSIADALVVKDGDLFFLCDRGGDVPCESGHGLGLYYHDCRYLNGYTLRLAKTRLDSLVASAVDGFSATLVLTNPDLKMADDRLIQKEELGLKWQRVIDGDHQTLLDRLTIAHYGHGTAEFELGLTFQTDFEDIFAVRGLLAEKTGKQREPSWDGGRLRFVYDGADGLIRALTIAFDPPPSATDGTTARFALRLDSQERRELDIALTVAEERDSAKIGRDEDQRRSPQAAFGALHRSVADWLGDRAEIASNSLAFNNVVGRSLRDLRLLRSSLRGCEYLAAGVPWFVALFGRDSLIAAYETLAYEPELAADTLRLLAGFQGQRIDDWRDEQPGKILHELRVGEMAHLDEIPQTPYYGSVDATPLFLILLAAHADWTGRLDLFEELRANVELALDWIDRYGADPNGYLVYQSNSQKGLTNQGWKDSGDGIVNADGSLARPPIALVEVQGYVYLAKRRLADLFARAGNADRAEKLRRQADELRGRFNRDFWLRDQGTYTLALQAEQEPCAVVSSNPGQALWTGIVADERAGKVVDSLLDQTMFSGWGVRTLASDERAYNPIGYHLGTVWPHDNALIAAGCRRAGRDDAFAKIFAGIVAAATHFHHSRLPEVFAGYERAEYGVPVRYPVACHPQAWAAGAVPYLLATGLGLQPDAFGRRLRIVGPLLPEGVDRLTVRRLRVGDARVDLHFRRGEGDRVDVDVLGAEGDLAMAIADREDGA